MAKPTYYPEWASLDATLPNTGNVNKVRPKESLRTIGWDKGQIPAAEEFNWHFDNVSDWIQYLDGYVDNVVSATSLNISDTLVKRDSSGNFSAGTISASLSGNATSASKWQTARTLSLTGAVTGSASIDGSGNVSLTTSVSNNGVSILTGTISHGGIIPLPSGYTEGQCKWMVSPNDSGNNAWDINENASYVHFRVICSANGTRVVTSQTVVFDDASDALVTYNTVANYIIIGVK